jgi:hypothetical protein
MLVVIRLLARKVKIIKVKLIITGNTFNIKRLTLHLRGDDHDGIVTHGRSREFRMHMKNPAETGSGCIRFNDLKIKQATFPDKPPL